jgi:Family of unknown function (DUF6524)
MNSQLKNSNHSRIESDRLHLFTQPNRGLKAMTLTGTGVLARGLFALFLVILTYNPSGYSYFHWLAHNIAQFTPYLAIAGIALLIGWGVYLKATFNSLGLIGILILIALFACLVWLFIFWGWLSLTHVSAVTWIVEIFLALLLTTGMCWSHITRKLSGQIDVDEIEES